MRSTLLSRSVYVLVMKDDRPLHPADPAALVHTLSYGLRFSTTGKAQRHGDALAAKIAAEILVQHLEQAGYGVMKTPPARNMTPLEPGGPKRLTE